LQIIQTLGYSGVFVLMLAESTLLPIPSEGVMPFVGYLTAQGNFNLILVLAVATIGTIIGSLISYYIGKYLGKPIVSKYGKYFFIKEKELDDAEKWFEKHGEKTIFICRFIPVIRHVVSLPAGAAKMKRRKFIFYTALGGLIWNGILLYAGIVLEKNWNAILAYTQYIDAFVIIIIVLGAIYLIYKQVAKKK